MRGNVKFFNSEKGYGFIRGEDGKEYFFHVSSVLNFNESGVDSGVEVIFNLESKPKGPTAIDIKVSNKIKPVFIVFGDIRIKLSNIKEYGIYKTGAYKEEFKNITIGGLLSDFLDGSLVFNDKGERRVKVPIEIDCLYITTFQKENYTFNSNEVTFDVNQKLKELDSFLAL